MPSNPVNPLEPDFTKLYQQALKSNSPFNATLGSSSKSFFERGVDHEEYRDKGLNFVLGSDNRSRLAEAQPFTEQLNRTLNPLKLVSSIALGIAENVGYLGDLILDWDERDYSNALTEWAINKKQDLQTPNNGVLGSLIGSGEAYRKNPEKTWDATDSAWWLNNGAGLVESIGEFFVTGAGIGKGLSMGAKALAKAAQFNAVATLGSQAAAQIGTAATLAYTEGAMSGARVFKDVYQDSISKGMSDEDAKAIASDAASHTVYVNTLVNTALNMTSVGSLFKTGRAAKEVSELGLRKAVGETTAEYALRLKKLAANPEMSSQLKRNIGKMVSESLQEGTEEVVNLIAEKEGYERGGMGEYSLLDTVFSSESGLNFVLGAVGGVGQTVVMEKIPFNKSYKLDSNNKPIPKRDVNGDPIPGEFETEFKSMSQLQNEDRFKKYADYINTFSEDLDNSYTLSNKLQTLTEQRNKGLINKQDYEIQSSQIKRDLFNTSLLNSLYNGTASDLGDRFKEIAQLDNKQDLGEKLAKQSEPRLLELSSLIRNPEADPQDVKNAQLEIDAINKAITENTGFTEAMKMGLADSMEDNSYSQKAQLTASEIDRRTKTYNELVDRFNFGDEETFNLAHYVFSNQIHIEDLSKGLEEINSEISKLESIAPSTVSLMDVNSMQDLLIKQEAIQTSLNGIKKVLEETRKSIEEGSSATVKSLKRKWKVKSVEEVSSILEDKRKYSEQQLKSIEDSIQSEYELMKSLKENEGKDNNDLAKSLAEELLTNTKYIAAKESKIKLLELQSDYTAEIEAYSKRHTEMLTARGRDKFIEISKKNYEEAKEKAEKKRLDSDAKERAKQARNQTAVVSQQVVSEEQATILNIGGQDQDFDELVKEAESKKESAEDLAKEFVKTVNELAIFDFPSFDRDLQIKRIDLVSSILEKLEQEEKVKDTNDFAQVSFWMYETVGAANFQDVYNVFKGIFIIVKDDDIKNNRVRHLNKEFSEMFSLFGKDPQDKGFHGVDQEDIDSQEISEKETLGLVEDFKIVDAANAVAYKTREFKEDKKGVKSPVNNDIYTYTNPIVLTNKIKEGTEVTFRVVNQELIDQGKVDPVSSMIFEEKGNQAARVPIQVVAIVDNIEHIIGYVHSVDYITESRVSSKNDNIQIQTQAIIKLRNDILSGKVKTATIASKSRGFLSRNSERTNGVANNRLTEIAIKGDVEFIVYTGDGSFKSSSEATFSKKLINKVNETSNKKFYKEGAVYAVLPTPNGELYAHLLQTNTLNSNQVNTVIEIIKAAFTNNKKIADDISDITGENILTPSGLEKVINRFVFSGNYDHDRMKVSSRRYLNITPNGVLFSEAKSVLNVIDKKNYNEKDFDKLRYHLGNMFFNINTAYLNDSKYKDVTIKDGNVSFEEVPYSALIKKVTLSDVNSLPTGDGEYAYFENSVLQFNPKQESNETSKENAKDETYGQEVLEVSSLEGDTLKSISKLVKKRISEVNKNLVLDLPGFPDYKDKFKTIRANIRGYLQDNNIINKYNQITNYQKFYGFKMTFNKVIKEQYSFITSDVVMEKKEMNALPKVIFREDYLKEIDRQNGLFYDLPDFRSVDEIENSINSLNESYKDFIVDLEKFSPQVQEDIVMTIASEANAIIQTWEKGKKKSFGEVMKQVRRELEDENDPSDKEIWNKFFKLAEQRLTSIYKIKLVDLEDISSFTDWNETGDREDTQNFDDGRVFKEDSKKTLSRELKTFFSFIRTDNMNSLGFRGFADFDTIYNNTKALLSGLPPNFNLMMERIIEYKDSYPYMKDMIEKLSNADETTKRQFVVDMTSHYTTFKMIFWKNSLHPDKVKDSKGQFIYNTTAQIIDINRVSIEKRIKEQWAENLKQISGLIITKDQNRLVDIKALREIGKALKEIEPSDLTELQDILATLGIEISIKALESLRAKSDAGEFKKIKSWEGQFGQRGIFGKILESIEKTTELNLDEDNIESNTELYNNTGIAILAREESMFTDRILSNSHKDGEGNTIYSYSVNKYAIDRKNSLKEVNSELVSNLKQLAFNGTSKYLEWLQTNNTFREFFDIFYIDTLNKKGREGVKASRQSARENEMLRLSLFFNEGKTARAGSNVQRLINAITPTNSDKSVPLAVSTIGLDVSLKRNGSIDDGTLDAIYNTVLGEINRINLWARLKREQRLSEVNNQGFEDGGGLFYFFPELNNKEVNSQIWNGDEIRIDGLDEGKTKDYIKEKINSYILRRADEKVREWQQMSLIHINGEKEYLSFFDTKYLDTWVKNKLESEVKDNMTGAAKYIAIDYLANELFTNGNLFQTIIGDPAMFFVKSKTGTTEVDIEATLVNLGKRLANQIAPGRSGAEYTDGQFIQIYLKDLKQDARDMEKIRKLFKNPNPADTDKINKNQDITITDAQELTTWRTHMNWMKSMGELSDDEAQVITSIIEEEKDINSLNKPLKDLIERFGNPNKPVYTHNKQLVSLGIEEIIYNKMSSFPLIPQLTKGLEIDKLRLAMERLERREKKDVRAIYNSGAKVGASNKSNQLNIWSDDAQGDVTLPNEKEWDKIIKRGKEDEILNSLFSKSTKLLPYIGLRKQQEVPFEAMKKAIVDGTQQRKMIFLNVLKENGFKYNGESLTGKELYERYITEYEKLFKILKDSLVSELEYNEETGEINFEKLSALLVSEAELRNWSINDKKALALEYVNNKATGFKAALWSVANSSRFESLLKSLIDNRILKNKISGRSWVLGSPAGFKPAKDYSELSEAEKGGIIYTKDFNFNGGLRGNEVFMPFRFRDSKGVMLDVKDFIDARGFIDETKFDPELLNLFGYRIPTEGPNSMAGLRIAGFIPNTMGDLIIASGDLIAQMGSDFDIDKLYSFMYNSDFTEEGNLKKFVYDGEDEDLRKMDIQNKLIDIHLSIMNNPSDDVQKQIKSPTGYGKLESWRDRINALRSKKSVNMLDPDYQREKYLGAMEGKDGIGVFALNMTLNASLQLIDKDVYLHYEQSDENTGEMKSYKYQVNLGGYRSGVLNKTKTVVGNRFKSEIMSAYTTAHTDAEKMQIHSALNINTITYDAIRILNQLGYEEDTVIPFINQPIILRFVASVKQESDSLHKVTGRVKEQVMAALLDEYSTKYGVEIKTEDFEEENLSEEDMVGCIEKGEDYMNYGLNQIKALVKYAQISRIGDALGQVQQSINTEAKGVGRDLIEANNKLLRAIDILDYESNNKTTFVGFKHISEVLGEFSNTPKEGFFPLGVNGDNQEVYLKPNTLQGFAVTYGLKQVSDMFNQFYPYNSRGLKEIYKEFKVILDKDFLTVDEQRWIWSEVKKFINSRPSLGIFKSQDLEAERQRLLYDKVNRRTIQENEYVQREVVEVVQMSIASRVREARKKFPNNMFLKSLGTKVNFNKPSKIIFHASTGENESEIRLYQDFIELIINKETREMAKDIISYAYITGGVQKAVEFIRYVPFEYLELAGYHKDLKELSFNDPETLGLVENKSHSWEVSRATKQIIQHNPNRAYILKEDLSQIDVSNPKKFSRFFIKKEAADDFIIDKSARVPGSTNSVETLFRPFVALFDKDRNNSYRLFEYVRENGLSYYNEIETLGTFGSSEYNSVTDEARTLINSNRLTFEEALPQVPVKAKTNLRNVRNLTESVQGIEVTNFLRSFSNNSPYKKLADYIADAVEFKNPNLKLVAQNMPGDGGSFDTMNNTVILGSSTSNRMLEQVAVHEFIHAVTMHEIRTSNSEVKESVNKLKRLKKDVISNLSSEQKENLVKMQQIYATFTENRKSPSDAISGEDSVFFKKNMGLLYPLIDIKNQDIDEFVTGIMSSPELQLFMNDIKYSESKTMLERFMNLVADIISSFLINNETKVKKDSVLYEAMKESLYLIGVNGENASFNKQKEQMVDDYIGVTFGGEEDAAMLNIDPPNITEDDAPILFMPSVGDNEVSKLLRNIPEKSNFKKLASFLADAIDRKYPELALVRSDIEGGYYYWKEHKIELGTKIAENKREETLLHEVVHALTSRELEVSTSLLTPSVKRLLEIKKLAIEGLTPKQKADLERNASIVREFADGEYILMEDRKFFNKNLDFLYPLTRMPNNNGIALDEFISGVMTSPKLQAYLNNIPYPKEKKTLLQKFLDIIADILDSFKVGTGRTKTTIKEDSALRAAMEDVLFIINSPYKSYDDYLNGRTDNPNMFAKIPEDSQEAEIEDIEKRLIEENLVDVVCKF